MCIKECISAITLRSNSKNLLQVWVCLDRASNIASLGVPGNRVHENKLSVAEMRTGRRICGKTTNNRLKNENIRRIIGVAQIKDKRMEKQL